MSSIYYLSAGDTEATRLVGRFDELLTTDHVFAHDLITVPHLTSLPDLAEGLPITVDLTLVTPLWPPMPLDPESDLSWMAEPVIERIADSLRDRLAAIDPNAAADVIAAWTEEVEGAIEHGAAAQVATDVILLAQRGRDRHLGLYNWYEM